MAVTDSLHIQNATNAAKYIAILRTYRELECYVKSIASQMATW